MSRFRSVVFIACIFVFVAMFAGAPSAQAQSGTISGTVTDSSGAVVAGAQVTIRDMQTGISRDTTTNSQGFYTFSTVKPSKYELTVEVKGFEKAVKRDISVVVGLESHLDVALTPGSVSESIEIKAEVPLIEPDKTNLSFSVDTQQIQNLPLLGRNFLTLAQLTPGVTVQAPGTQAGGINVSGMRSQSNNFTLDGVSVNDPQVNGPLFFNIADAVQEFNVNTSIANTDLGRSSGAQVQIITKSGGNAFHGSAFYYGRNEALDANDWFLNHAGKSKNMLRRHQYGGTMGGPLIKDKTFWFFNFEGFRQKNPLPQTSIVPTDAARASVTDPVSLKLLQFIPHANIPGATGTQSNWAGTADQFNNNDTYLGRVDHNLTRNNRLSGHYAMVHGTNLSLQQNPFNGSITNVPASHSAVIEETFTHNRWLNVARIGFARNLTKFGPQDVTLNPASIFTDAAGNPLPGFVDTTKSARNGGLPRITITSSAAVPLSNFGLGAGTNMPQGRTTDTYQLMDNVTWMRGSHTLSFGGEARREETFRFLNGNFRGAISFPDWNHFALGRPQTGSLRAGGPDETFRSWTRNAYYMYVQDSWKMKSNLTFNYGVRYERPGTFVEKGDSGSNFVPGVGMMKLNSNLRIDVDPTKQGQAAITLTPVSTFLPRSGQFSEANKNFAPFGGLAWSPRILRPIFGDGKTVIRTGFRLGYDDVFNNIPVNMGLNIGQSSAPFLLSTTLPTQTCLSACTPANPAAYTWGTALNQNRFLFAGDATVPGGSRGILGFNAWDTTGRTAYGMNYALEIERQIGNAYAVEASYVGTLGRKLGLFLDANQPFVTVNDPTRRGSQTPNQRVFPFPQYSGIAIGAFGSNSNYNGGVFSIRKKPSHGLTLQASYTFAKSFDYNSAFFGSSGEFGFPADSRNLRAEYGPSAFDIRHQFVASYLYQMPVGKGRAFLHDANRFLDYVVGGWDVGGITNLHTGFPFTIFASSTIDFSGFNQFADRPIVTGPTSINYSNPDKVFATGNFSLPAAGNIGNAGRNAYYGPSYVDFDFSLQKNFSITESKKFQFRAEFFNLFNHPNFDLPVGNLASGSVGKIIGDTNANPRLMQLGLRFDF